MPDDEIYPSWPVTIRETDINTLNHYRSLYLSKKITPGSGSPAYLVFAGTKLFGFLIFQPYSVRNKIHEIYMLSDFVVPSTRYPRLAKLLLMITQCREMKALIEERLLMIYDGILTTAFTEKPVSMKYRGIYTLHKRGKGFLNYRTDFHDTSTQEVIYLWSKKYKQ